MGFVAAKQAGNPVAVARGERPPDEAENLVVVTGNNRRPADGESLAVVGNGKQWPDRRMAATEHLDTVHLEPMDNLLQRQLFLLLMPSLLIQSKNFVRLSTRMFISFTIPLWETPSPSI